MNIHKFHIINPSIYEIQETHCMMQFPSSFKKTTINCSHCCIHRWRYAAQSISLFYFAFVWAFIIALKKDSTFQKSSRLLFVYVRDYKQWCCFISNPKIIMNWERRREKCWENSHWKNNSFFFQYFIFYQKINFIHWHQY